MSNSTSAVMSSSVAIGVPSWVDLRVAYLDALFATGDGAFGISSDMAFSLRLC